MNKKGIFEVQFNWIFILIAGAVILAFFFSVVQKQQSLSQQKLSLSLLNEFDAITTGAFVAKGAAQRVNLPRAGIDFSCDACNCQFNIDQFSRDYDDKIIFAPKHIEGKDVVFWTLDWQVPYRAANFLYMTNDRIKYFIVHDKSAGSQRLRERVTKQLPEQVNAEFIEVDQICNDRADCISNENYIQVKFVFLDIDLTQLSIGFDAKKTLVFDDSFEDTDVTAVHLTGNEANFFDIKKEGVVYTPDKSHYAGDASLYGAIFAQDVEMYNCNMMSAARRLGYVTEIIREKALLFTEDDDFVKQTGCAYDADESSILKQYSNLAFGQGTGITQDINQVTAYSQQLETTNEQLIRDSCPTLY